MVGFQMKNKRPVAPLQRLSSVIAGDIWRSILTAIGRYLIDSREPVVDVMAPRIHRPTEGDDDRRDYEEALTLLLTITARPSRNLLQGEQAGKPEYIVHMDLSRLP